LPYNLIRWDIKIIPAESEVSFSIVPSMGWDQEIQYDSVFIEIRKKFDQVFRIKVNGEMAGEGQGTSDG
jgi:hypothetical protein